MAILSCFKVSKLITELTAAVSCSSHGFNQWSRWPTQTTKLWWNRWENFIHLKNLRQHFRFLKRNGNKLWSPKQKETFCSRLYSQLTSGNTSTFCSGTFLDNVWILPRLSSSRISLFSCKLGITVSNTTLNSGISLRQRTLNGSQLEGNGLSPYLWFWFCSKLLTSWSKNKLISFKPCLEQDQPERWLRWSTRNNFVCLPLPTRNFNKDRLSISYSQMPTSSSGWVLLCHK